MSENNAPSPSTSIVLYDIAFAPPYDQNTSAPNPWKARYALNFKGVPYSTQWVQMPDIGQVRRSLGLDAGRKFADGSPFYTLPVLSDASSKTVIGDSFDIAEYLQKTFPDAGAGDLFPEQDLDYTCPGSSEVAVPLSEQRTGVHAAYARFNTHVDTAFTKHTQLCVAGMHWDPAYEEDIKAEFLRRVGLTSWEQLDVEGEARAKLIKSFEETLAGLAEMFRRDGSGTFLLGGKPSYADVIVGGWLRMVSKTLPKGEWAEVRAWYGGVFGLLHDALQERFGNVK